MGPFLFLPRCGERTHSCWAVPATVTDRVTLYQGAPGGMYQGAPGGLYQGAPGGMYQGAPGGMYRGAPGGMYH